MIRYFFSCLFVVFLSGCAVFRLTGYAIAPGTPELDDGDELEVVGLHDAVDITLRADGLWSIAASNNHDLNVATGFLQARDRTFQLDLLRHLATGRIAELVGNVKLGKKTALELDRQNRFLGFTRTAKSILATTSDDEIAMLEAFTVGINAWIDEGKLPLEHKVLGHRRMRPWTIEDTASIYAMLMYGLSGNWAIEARRLLTACNTSIEQMEAIWPTSMDFGYRSFDDEISLPARYEPFPSVVSEVAQALPMLCNAARAKPTQSAALDTPVVAKANRMTMDTLAGLQHWLHNGSYASNNWAVAGEHTASGKPMLSDDPHLPLMNPPIIWGVHQKVGDHEMAGFSIVGTHRLAAGHNNKVAWGVTTNYLDRQDLVLQLPRNAQGQVTTPQLATHYLLDNDLKAFEVRTESFTTKDGDVTTATARFIGDEVVLQDIDPTVGAWLPLATIRRTRTAQARDFDGAAGMGRAQSATEWAQAVDNIDLGCTNWVFADQESIGYRSPCRLPIRQGYSGLFPIAGWVSAYAWGAEMPKSDMPKLDNPKQGWIATANNALVSQNRFATPMWNEQSSPNRSQRIAERLPEFFPLTQTASSFIQRDVQGGSWNRLRISPMSFFCRYQEKDELAKKVRAGLCNWSGESQPDSWEATIFELMIHALIDHQVLNRLDRNTPAERIEWLQHTLKFEARVQWMLHQDPKSPAWDDVRTVPQETRLTALNIAMLEAIAIAQERYGETPDQWAWGMVHPLVITHPFATNGGLLGGMLNTTQVAGVGSPTSLFKNQFYRSDRDRMKVEVGPVFRFTIDMAAPKDATFSLAGGESGWAKSPRYGNLVPDWRFGNERKLIADPHEDDRSGQLIPPRD